MNEGAGGLGRLGTIVGAIAAPTSLVTALLYYFGYYHAYWFFAYFRVNSTVLGFGTADYLMRSLDALWVPMTVTATVGLLAFWGHDLLRHRLATGVRPPVLRYVISTVAGLGFLLALGGLWSTFTRTFLNRVLALAPLSLSVGVSLLAYALHLRRTVATNATASDDHADSQSNAVGQNDDSAAPSNTDSTPNSGTSNTAPPRPATRPEWAALAEWAVVFVLVGLGLVWAANDYAASVGVTRAQRFVAGLSDYPSAVLYSERSLSISAPGVRETRCGKGKAAYGYRYDGLALILQSGNQYVLLPYRWTRADGVALVIPRNDSVRLEFGPPPSSLSGAAQHPAC
ncbi:MULTISPECIES: hypothetical protein [Streptomyces]|uniref:DUF3592 domain-containing protein n=1 Tax=Streptomyces dengpaensis TaxID=2049881 RepID=A0ABM6T146_9ACTN|nr:MULTISPECIES: hypothetical protein [Streptomyces]AVH60880.1 hypothetical protein C4B68_39910 [Streptomyces dengpaensis]PIA98506.1 hypothetical protein B1C81_39835 [Streptomyces sp. HG99]